jgi:hypothetical protein
MKFNASSLFAFGSSSLLLLASTTVVTTVIGEKNRPADVGAGVGPKKKARRRRNGRKLGQITNSDILQPVNPMGMMGAGPNNLFERTYQVITYEGNTNFYGGVIVNATSDTTSFEAFGPGANPPMGAGVNLLGTAFAQSSSVFRESTTSLGDFGGDILIDFPSFGPPNQPNRETLLPPNPDFFLQGVCKCTNAGGGINGDINDEPSLTFRTAAHSCLYDVCLGGGGFNCINFYSGTPFDFAVPAGFGPTGDGLPPPVSGFILGGTGAFYLVKGTALLTTIAGTSDFDSFGFGMRRRGRRSMQDNANDDTSSLGFIPSGPSRTIVQLLTLKTNIELPPGPGVDGITTEPQEPLCAELNGSCGLIILCCAELQCVGEGVCVAP